jgi:DNA polymerase-3 subunit epsilon
VLSLGLQGALDTSGKAQGRGGYAVVDVEATGSSSRRHRVVELAVVLLDRERRPQGEFSTLVDPGGPVGPTHIHGIEPHHLIPAPRFAQIAPRLLGLLRGRVLVGHNVGCDRAFLVAEYARMGVDLPQVPEVCTMRLAQEHLPPSPYGLSLRACAAAAGLPEWAAHTALGDARASGQLLARCAPADEGVLDQAQAVRWPRLPRTSGGDAAWVGRPVKAGSGEPGIAPVAQIIGGNDSACRMATIVGNGSA